MLELLPGRLVPRAIAFTVAWFILDDDLDRVLDPLLARSASAVRQLLAA